MRRDRKPKKLVRFPEGDMTEIEWVLAYAESVEQFLDSWLSLFDRTKFNRMDGEEQRAYEEELKIKAARPRFRAWRKGSDTFFHISKATFESAKKQSVRERVR